MKRRKSVLRANILIELALLILLPLSVCAQNAQDPVNADVLYLSLDSCIQKALRNNAAWKNAELDVLIAEQTKKEAVTMYFPHIEAGAAAFHSDKPFIEYGIGDISDAGIRNTLQALYMQYGNALGIPNSIGFLEKGVVAGVTAIQPIYAGGRIVAGNKLAGLGVDAAKYKQQIARRDIILKCEELYWQVYALEQKRNTVESATDLLENLHKDVGRALEAGLVLKNDLLRVELELNKMRSNKLQLESGRDLAKSALCQYIGEAEPDSLVLLSGLSGELQNPEMFKIDALASVSGSYEAELLDLSVEAEKLKKRMTLGAALPQIGFGGAYAYNNLMEKDYTNLVGFAAVRLPLSEWWSTAHKLKKHRFEIQKAENTRNDLMQQLALRTTKIYDDLETSYRQVMNAESSVANAKENLRLSRDNYNAGLVSLSEMLEAQALYMQAMDFLTEETINYKIKLLHYMQLTRTDSN